MNNEEKKPYGFCRNCGQPFTKEGVFCEECGSDLSNIKESIKNREQKEREKEQLVTSNTNKGKKDHNVVIGFVAVLLIVGLVIGDFI